MRDNASFSMKGQVWKTMDLGPMDGVLMSTSLKKLVGDYGTQICYLVCFLRHKTNPPSVPKRILEASFISPPKDDPALDQETIFYSGFVTSEYN